MVRGKKQPEPKRDVRYLNVDLTKEMKSSLVKWLEEHPNLLEQLEKACDTGLKFGASFDNYNECFQAQFTRIPGFKEEQITLVLVGRGGTLLQAMQALVFKYFAVLNEELEDGEIKNGRGITDWG